MKTLVDFDFGWALNACLCYARRQAALLAFIDDNKIDISDTLDIIRLANSEKEAIEKLEDKNKAYVIRTSTRTHHVFIIGWIVIRPGAVLKG